MVRFSSCCEGADMYICQVCGKDLCSKCKKPEWRPDITKHKSAGNVCPECIRVYDVFQRLDKAAKENNGVVTDVSKEELIACFAR